MEFFTRNVRLLVLVIGFASSLAGTLGSFLFIESLNEHIEDLTNQRNEATREIDKLGDLTGDYFIANQQGDLIYALALQPDARFDLLALIYQGNLLDRADPMRNMIGAMALSGLLDYRQTYDAYEKLTNAALESTNFSAFLAVKQYEREIIEQAQSRVNDLQVSLVPLQEAISQAEGELRNRHQLSIIFSSAGAFLLLLANLVEHRRTIARTDPA